MAADDNGKVLLRWRALEHINIHPLPALGGMFRRGASLVRQLEKAVAV